MVEQNKPTFQGEILLCEDNELMQRIIQFQLEDIGFEITVANNGKECIDMVFARISNGESPFGLILMDIYMPVMGGIEAADILMEIGNQAPIAALTSNVGMNDMEMYKEHNMLQVLSKPFSPEELWSFLYQYFKPRDFKTESEDNTDGTGGVNNRLLTGFVKRNQSTFAHISTAIETGDIKLAHRLSHTLKGIAGLIGRTELQQVSRVVEDALAKGDLEHIDEQMAALGEELQAVLNQLSPLLEESKKQLPVNLNFDKAKAASLLEKLEPLLRGDNAKSKEFIDELKQIPGTGDLVEKIEEYEFEKALELLVDLKEALGGHGYG